MNLNGKCTVRGFGEAVRGVMMGSEDVDKVGVRRRLERESSVDDQALGATDTEIGMEEGDGQALRLG